MSFMNLFIRSYFGMTENKETIGVCVFLIYLINVILWMGGVFLPHT